MKIDRIISILTLIYILSLLILPWLVPNTVMSHLWNPFSLLHIPLYGVLMLLLTLTLQPKSAHPEAIPFKPPFLLLPGGVSFLIGVLDEMNQKFIPGREASIGDLLLNLTGILLASIGIYFWRRRLTKIRH